MEVIGAAIIGAIGAIGAALISRLIPERRPLNANKSQPNSGRTQDELVSRTRVAQESQSRPVAIFLAAITFVACGAIIGITTNAINGYVSPLYFVNILEWHDVDNVQRAAIAQGVLEGVLYGFVMGLVFAWNMGSQGHGKVPYGYAAKYIFGTASAVYATYTLGGLVAVGLAALSPDFYRNAFVGVPEAQSEMLSYAWVGGAIWGAVFGGLLCFVVGLAVFRSACRRDFSGAKTT